MSGQCRRAAIAAASVGLAVAVVAPWSATRVLAGSITVNNITLPPPIGNGSSCPSNSGDISPLALGNWDVTTGNSRPWADIKSFSATEISYAPRPAAGIPPGLTTGGFVNAIQVTVDLCSSLPTSFPATNGDSGVGYYFSWDDPNDYPCGGGSLPFGGPPPRQIGTGSRGQPIFDGPFPACAGYRYFGFLDVTALGGVDFGVGWYDPIGQYTALDTEQTIHTPTNGNADPANIGVFTSSAGLPRSEIRLIIPQRWVWQPGTTGLWLAEPVYQTGRTLQDVAVASLVQTSASAPTTVCGLPVIGCTPTGIFNRSTQVETVPGEQACPSLAGTGPGDTSIPDPVVPPARCPTTSPYSFDYGLLWLGDPLQAIQTPVGGPTIPSYTIVVGTASYDLCAPDTWPSGVPGQGPGQSAGPLHNSGGVCSTVLRTVIPSPYAYASIWGRIVYVPSNVPVYGNEPIGGTYVPNGEALAV